MTSPEQECELLYLLSLRENNKEQSLSFNDDSSLILLKVIMDFIIRFRVSWIIMINQGMI